MGRDSGSECVYRSRVRGSDRRSTMESELAAFGNLLSYAIGVSTYYSGKILSGAAGPFDVLL